MITIHYSSARCGAGKTQWACERIARNPGRFILAVDRREVIARRKASIQEFSEKHRTKPKVIPLFSRSDTFTDGIRDVRRRIREAGAKYQSEQHVVIIVTHEALKSSDLSTYQGWTLIIDEVPSIWTKEEVRTPRSWEYLDSSYNLLPIGNTGWSTVQAKSHNASIADYHRDTYLNGLAVFRRRVKDQGVYVSLSNWEDASTGDPWSWFSIWNPEELEPFSAVYILGNAFEYTITYKLLANTFSKIVNLKPFEIPDSEPWLPRSITIRYFASKHTAGTAFWTENEDGRECLRRVPNWVNDHSDPSNHYWSCNIGRYDDTAMIGTKVSPKIAGSNDYKDITCGTFIYTSKPSGAEERVLGMFDITRDQIIRAREREDIIQMFWRCSIRNPMDTRPVEFRVYDREQATFLADFIKSTLPGASVTLERIDLGLDVFRPKPVGRSRKVKTDQEIKEAQERKRENARLRQARHRAEMAENSPSPRRRGRRPKARNTAHQ